METEKARRELQEMPFDKMFQLGGGRQELCHSTGYEVCFDEDTTSPGNWWLEYEDAEGNLHYGR